MFLSKVSSETKIAIVKALNQNFPVSSQDLVGKPKQPYVYKNSTLKSFISSESWLFLLDTKPTFFECASLNRWQINSSFQQLLKIVSSFMVINDFAEGCVKFGSNFTDLSTTDKNRQQNIFQQVDKSAILTQKQKRKFFLGRHLTCQHSCH